MNITTVVEAKRGCGYRQPGGLYLRTDGMGRVCGALPIELTVCPTCNQGIKPARGWTWINIAALVDVRGCNLPPPTAPIAYPNEDLRVACGDCPIADAKIQMAGLLWIGEKFYKNTASFQRESEAMGISRRITMVPRNFRLGETWVALAHRKAINLPNPYAGKGPETIEKPGIFHIFKPSRIEYVVKSDDSEEKLEKLEKRGFTLVKVEKEQTEMEVVTKNE
jgi:hypothetical protein